MEITFVGKKILLTGIILIMVINSFGQEKKKLMLYGYQMYQL